MLLVWSGAHPRCHAAPIPPGGLALGRDLLESMLGSVTEDDRISRKHTQVEPGPRTCAVRDLRSRNGTFVDGHLLDRPNSQPYRADPFTVVRTGRTVWLLVPDITRCRSASLTRRGRLVVGGSLVDICAAVEEAARDRVNLLLRGPLTIGRELARSYAMTLGNGATRFDPSIDRRLREVLDGAQARALVLELTAPLAKGDARLLEAALANELRVVTLCKKPHLLEALPPGVQRSLSARQLALPAFRYEEMSTTVFDLIRDYTPAAKIHATVVEHCLIRMREIDEDSLLGQVRLSLLRWRARPTPTLRGEHLMLIGPSDLERMAMPGLAHKPHDDEPSAASWHDRRLCSDGACFGVISEGRCGVCGRLEPLGDPYR